MKILAIDTSCDDTCCAILEIKNRKFRTLSNIVSSQVKIHRKYGGVYPFLAKREHQKNLVPILKKGLKNAGELKKYKPSNSDKKIISREFISRKEKDLRKILSSEEVLFKKLKIFLKNYQKPKIDLIAVTVGPGLDPCLWQGVNFARALSYSWKLPIVPVNHIEAHILVNFINKNSKEIKLPALCLIVSGGHTQLILIKRKPGKQDTSVSRFRYKIIGETRDDAAGECFDKTARILGLPYPGGPAIAKEAEKILESKKNKSQLSQKFKIKLPRPMINSQDYDFSFSGLKTAVLYDFKKRPKKVRCSKEYVREMAKEIQQAVIDTLLRKTIKALRDYKAETIILGGGVASNKELRKQFKEKIKKDAPHTKLIVPDPDLCTDNALMTAIAGYFNRDKKKNWQKIKAKPNLQI